MVSENHQVIQLPPLYSRASLRTLDEAARTVDVTFSTGAAVHRHDLFTGERYVETLSLDPQHINLTQLNNDAPLLNAHRNDDMDYQIGVVVAGTARVEQGAARATVRFSRRPEVEPIWQDVRDGITRNISVGYVVHQYEERPATERRLKQRKAINWEPMELSMVPIGADAGAKIRAGQSATTYPCTLIPAPEDQPARKEHRAMPEETAMAAIPEADGQRREPRLILEASLLDPGAPITPGLAPVPRAPEPSERDLARAEERNRCAQIMVAVRQAGFLEPMAFELISEGHNLEKARGMVLERLGKVDRGPNNLGPAARPFVSVEQNGDPHSVIFRGMENALLVRMDPRHFQLNELGQNYRNTSIVRMMEIILQTRGVRVTGMGPLEIVQYATSPQTLYRGPTAYHTTSDFALLFQDAANKALRKAYEEAAQTFGAFTRRTTVSDFKTINRMQLGEAPALLKVNEHGEFTRGTIGEAKESYAVETYGRVFGISRKAIINDDTDAFSRMIFLFGRSARQLESDLAWAQLTSNPTMGDGQALFSVAHKNLAASGTAISIDSLGLARAAMRQQTSLDGTTYINIMAQYLAVPTGKETLADQVVTPIQPVTVPTVNPFQGKFTVIAEPRLDANSLTAWYVIAGGDQEVLELATLAGQEGPFLDARTGFDIDGIETKCRHDVGVKMLDWRGVYKNPGA